MVKDKEFKNYLNQLSDPNYQGGSWFLPENASAEDKLKYEICQGILLYQRQRKLTDEELAKKINLTLPETQDILYYRITHFNLNQLLNCANKLNGKSQMIWIDQPWIQQNR